MWFLLNKFCFVICLGLSFNFHFNPRELVIRGFRVTYSLWLFMLEWRNWRAYLTSVYTDTVKSMLISCLLLIILIPGVKGIVCMKGIIKCLHMKTHLMTFFPEMLIEKKLLKICLCLSENSKTDFIQRYRGTFSF